MFEEECNSNRFCIQFWVSKFKKLAFFTFHPKKNSGSTLMSDIIALMKYIQDQVQCTVQFMESKIWRMISKLPKNKTVVAYLLFSSRLKGFSEFKVRRFRDAIYSTERGKFSTIVKYSEQYSEHQSRLFNLLHCIFEFYFSGFRSIGQLFRKKSICFVVLGIDCSCVNKNLNCLAMIIWNRLELQIAMGIGFCWRSFSKKT